MMKVQKNLIILMVLAILTSFYCIGILNGNRRTKDLDFNDKKLNLSGDPFLLLQDFGASTYYISPEASPGSNDEVFFSFSANKNGNFSIAIKNFPNQLTSTVELEDDVAFDNPSGTDLWYLSYLELDIEFEGEIIHRIGTYKIKLLISDDKGRNWEKKTIAEFTPSGDNFLELFYDLAGVGISAYPEVGLIGAVSWYNYSDLIFVGSEDNGMTWNSPKTIVKADEIGANLFFNPIKGFYPLLETCILKNSTIYVLTQANSPSYSPVVYFQSNDNGITWSGPKNVTVSHGNYIKKIKMQVNHQSGDFWFMWMYTNDTSIFDIKWAQFHEWNNETLYSSCPVNTIYSGKDCNFDFLYDWAGSLFRMIQIHPIGLVYPFEEYEVLSLNCFIFGNSWDISSLGYHDALESQYISVNTLNFAYDENQFQLFYEAFYTGFTEVYQYYVFKNPIFWEANGFFVKDEPIQVHWNGRINNTIPITISTVKVEFVAQNDTDTISTTKYITIDNNTPYFEDYVQKNNYFNPLSSNITFSEVNWDLLASEECSAYMEIFKQGITLSKWQKITNNNLHEKDPKIFRSNTGELFILYRMVELGTKIVYLIKSYDNGISWSNPIEIIRIESDSLDFRYEGAAWGPVVLIYIRNVDTGEDLLYRSFNGGEFFEPPILMTNIGMNEHVEKIILTNHGSVFLLYRNYPALYTVIRSNDLGFNWMISAQWTDYPQNFTIVYDRKADMAYDFENNLLHVVLPYLNHTLVANYLVATLDVSNNTWRSPRGTGTIYPMGLLSKEPKLLITRAPEPPFVKLKIIYIQDQEIMGSWTNYTIKEIISDDLGETWLGPFIVENSNNATIFTSSIFDTFYVTQKSDGNDYEIYFSREGSLIRTKKETLSSASYSELSFDGIDDFGDYISEGNYSYNLHLRDDAGNFINIQGWFYADYNAPQITEPISNWAFPPTPRLDVEITTYITDDIGFSPFLYYKRDLENWNIIPMENIGGDTYLAVIPHDNITNIIQYYIKAVDFAGNIYYRDRNNLYYTYDMPRYDWESLFIFNETQSYSSSKNYEISISINSDLEYVLNLIFCYSYDGGNTWHDLELLPNSPEFSGLLENIPEDTKILIYEILLNDIFGEQVILLENQQISFYPEIPSLQITGPESIGVMMIAAAVGFLVAYGYINLKSKSHNVIYKQIFLREYAKKTLKIEKETKPKKRKLLKIGRRKKVIDENEFLLQKSKGASPFTIAYLGILATTLAIFFLGYVFTEINPQGGILLLAASLVLSIFGYMILISRDISLNIYLEKIFKRNIMLEFFQIGFMLLNIIVILLRGYEIAWFRYYLIEQTYDLGTFSIPKLYISIFGVFFTSLILVMITTYLQLRKTVKNVQEQRSQGASDNLLLYIKDQNSSRLITQMGYKTIVFLVTILIGIVSTTNLLTIETGMALLVIIIPFVIAGFSALIIHRLIERRRQKEKAEEIELPFIDSKKVCNNCGKPIYLSNKYCGFCSNQVIYPENIGIYTSKCVKCDGYVYEGAKFCPNCGNDIEKQ